MTSTRQTALVIRSGPASQEARRALQLAQELKAAGETPLLCLIGDAVWMAAEPGRARWRIFCLEESLQIRGISPNRSANGIEVGTYSDLIDRLMADETRVIGSF